MLPPPLAKALGVGGEPKEYLQIEKLNEKLTSFEYSLRKASVSPASAKRERARQSLARQFGSEFAAFGLDAATVERVLEIQAEEFAEDLEVGAHMAEWSERRLRAYFEAGGVE